MSISGNGQRGCAGVFKNTSSGTTNELKIESQNYGQGNPGPRVYEENGDS